MTGLQNLYKCYNIIVLLNTKKVMHEHIIMSIPQLVWVLSIHINMLRYIPCTDHIYMYHKNKYSLIVT